LCQHDRFALELLLRFSTRLQIFLDGAKSLQVTIPYLVDCAKSAFTEGGDDFIAIIEDLSCLQHKFPYLLIVMYLTTYFAGEKMITDFGG